MFDMYHAKGETISIAFGFFNSQQEAEKHIAEHLQVSYGDREVPAYTVTKLVPVTK